MTPESSQSLVQNTHSVTTRQATLWWPGLLGALLLLLLEIAIRKLSLPDSWQSHFRKWREPRTPQDQPAGYDELVEQIEKARSEHLRAIRAYTRFQPDNPAARARLYVPQKNKRS